MTKVEKVILDRITVSEQKMLENANALLEGCNSLHEEAKKVAKRAKGEVERHVGETAPKHNYLADLKTADMIWSAAKRAYDVAERKAAEIKKFVNGFRAERAKAIQTRGIVHQVVPWRKPGMYQVTILVGNESITRHCLLVGGHYIALGGVAVKA